MGLLKFRKDRAGHKLPGARLPATMRLDANLEYRQMRSVTKRKGLSVPRGVKWDCTAICCVMAAKGFATQRRRLESRDFIGPKTARKFASRLPYSECSGKHDLFKWARAGKPLVHFTVAKWVHFWVKYLGTEIQAHINLKSGSFGAPRFIQALLKDINQALKMVGHRGIKIGLESAPQTGRKQIGPLALADLVLGHCTCFPQVIV